MRRGDARPVPGRMKRHGPSQTMFKSRPVYDSGVFFSKKRQRALGDGRTTSGTPRTNRREILKLVTSLPPSDPREREPELHLNRPDCNSTGTTTRPSEGSRGVAQPSSLWKRCVRDILIKSLLTPRTSKDFEGPRGSNIRPTNEFSRAS
jgi:hypothetical protein